MKDDLIARLRKEATWTPLYAEILREAADALEATSLRPPTQHAKAENGRCESWCYACERRGLQERVKFTEDYETLKYQLASLRPQEEKLELHRCWVCGTRWLLWPDAACGGGWNLLDKHSHPGPCCDNVAMGNQIEHLRDIPLSIALRLEEPQEDGIRFDAESNSYVARHTVLSAGRTEDEAKQALASAIRLTAETWPPRARVTPGEPPPEPISTSEHIAWKESHLARGHEIQTANGFDECTCGSTFWMPLPSPPASAPQQTTEKDAQSRVDVK